MAHLIFYLAVTGTKQGHFKGQNVHPGRSGWIEITGYSFEGLTRTSSTGGGGGGKASPFVTASTGGGGGKASPFVTASTGGGGGKASPFVTASTGGGGGKASITITKEIDSTSPQLMQACVVDELLLQVVLEIVHPKPGGKDIVVSRITLTNAQIRHILPFLSGDGTKSGQNQKLQNFHLTCGSYQHDVVGPHDAGSGFASGKRQH